MERANERHLIRASFVGAVVLAAALVGAVRPRAEAPQLPPPSSNVDGSHDFDFEIGCWKTHIRRLQRPLTGSATWVDYDGTSNVRKIWGGKANLVELEVDGPAGHIEGLSVRLYNQQSHEWSLNFANSAGGTFGVATVGEFKNGRGQFFDQESFGGRMILVRNVWKDITPMSGRFEQAFSDDGGKTWEINWIATDTRLEEDGGHHESKDRPPACDGDAAQ